MTVETCDVGAIPVVDHATFELQRFINATDNPTLLAQNFTIPNYVNVTYTCNAGYQLQDPNNNVIGCEYVTKPRNPKKGTMIAEALWTRPDGIFCEASEQIIM